MPFYGLDGFTGTITVGTRSKDFVNIGSAEAEVSYSALGRQVAVISDDTDPDSVEIVSQPSAGRAIARSDGKISIDLLDENPQDDITFTYNRTKDGATTQVEATVTVAATPKTNGWSRGTFYRPQTDANDKVIIEPNENTRRIFVDQDGITWADVIAAESGVSSNGEAISHILNDPATGGGGLLYGESAALALHPIAAINLFDSIQPEDGQSSSWLLFKRGQSFPRVSNEYPDWLRTRGESALHPIYVSSYGTGDEPEFPTDGPLFNLARNVANVVLQGGRGEKIHLVTGMSNILIEGYLGDGVYDPISASGGPLAFGPTLRNLKLIDGFRTVPKDGVEWNPNLDRVSGIYSSFNRELLVENCFIDKQGWEEGYRADGVTYNAGEFAMPFNIYSHCIYMTENSFGMHFFNNALTRPAFSGLQGRAGGHFQDNILIDTNAGLLLGQSINLQGGGFTNGNANTYSMCDRLVVTVGGYKDVTIGPPAILSQGLSAFDEYAHVWHSAFINTESERIGTSAMPVLVDGTSIGPCTDSANTNDSSKHKALSIEYGSNTAPFEVPVETVRIANWAQVTPNYNVDGVSQGTLDGLTAGAYFDILTGGSGGTYLDLIDRWRAADMPWLEFEGFIDFILTGLGDTDAVSTRAVAQTVTFAPYADHPTPRNQAAIKADWDTYDLPGKVDGDGVNLDGHSINWNITPKNSIDDFIFGGGQTITTTSGILEPTGDFIVDASGNTIIAENGAKVYHTGYSGSGDLSIDLLAARWMNKGTVAGNMNITNRFKGEAVFAFDAGAFTLSDGNTATVYGFSKAGFDGTGGGATTLTLATGSKLEFKPTIRLKAKSTGGVLFPKVGFTITGDTSGATGVVRYVEYRNKNDSEGWCDFMAVLDDVTGEFQNAESLSCETTRGANLINTYSEGFATVNIAPAYIMGSISEFITGVNGYSGDVLVTPDVDSTVTLGGTLHLDVTGVSNDTYTLIDVDTVSGKFDAVTAAGNSAKDLTVSITGTTVTVLVEDGDGTVTGGTS